jgi:Uma2 family endonuclease
MVETVEQPKLVRGAKLWPMSVEAYHVLAEAGVVAEDTELLYGVVYTKMAKSPTHTSLVRAFIKLFKTLESPNFFASYEQPLTLIDSEPEPDISFVKGAEEDFLEKHPTAAEFVIEICVTSHEYDRSKLPAYARGKVKECWLLLVPERKIEIYTNPEDGVYTAMTIENAVGKISSRALPELSIDLDFVFRRCL